MLHNEAGKLPIEALEKTRKVQEVADCYSVNRSTVYRLKKRWEETGSFETRTFLRGRKPALSPEALESIDQLVKDKPDITLQEIVDTLRLTVSIETVRKALLKLGYRRKKKALHASEQERPRCGGEAESLKHCDLSTIPKRVHKSRPPYGSRKNIVIALNRGRWG